VQLVALENDVKVRLSLVCIRVGVESVRMKDVVNLVVSRSEDVHADCHKT
jgi:hypothetical protein